MRSDMHEVVIERPRRGMRGPRMGPPKSGEELPLRESTSRRRGGTKYLNENLAPLRRFLRSRVGQPWNKVYSEISEHLRSDNAVQQHVRDHLDDFVARQVEWVDGELRRRDRRWRRGFRNGVLYVCPKTGLLRVWRAGSKPVVQPPTHFRWIDHRSGFGWMHGGWYVFAIERALNGMYLKGEPRVFDRRGVYIAAKRQLSKREIREAALPRLRA